MLLRELRVLECWSVEREVLSRVESGEELEMNELKASCLKS